MASARDNEALRCIVPGCGERRKGVRKLCAAHGNLHDKHGHWKARAVSPKEWACERNEVTTLLAINPDHPGLLNALDFIRSFLQTRTGRDTIDREMKVLRAAELTPLALLTELAAAYVWTNRNPAKFPDQRATDFVLSAAVLGLVPRPRRLTPDDRAYSDNGVPVPPTPASRKFIGKTLRESLSVMLASITVAVQAHAAAVIERSNEVYMAARAPLKLPDMGYQIISPAA